MTINIESDEIERRADRCWVCDMPGVRAENPDGECVSDCAAIGYVPDEMLVLCPDETGHLLCNDCAEVAR